MTKRCGSGRFGVALDVLLTGLVAVLVLGGCGDDDGEVINPRDVDASPRSAPATGER